ncbi:peptidase M28 [Siphonobacter sp. BAB-5385]|uniref:M20/M25/M40 family metallo-hydrolase n=1 Tax=unclassified Siphonobacter TaxID=2635712 RepID=UPI000B9E8C8F|nr:MULTISPECIES: M20/M25/M40 family metallo-hydrolase [unclassified Siphonobacter]OZI09094.1 peptidase M28 [Siphonobacter sp. BAB-5385]PMD98111.1 peptidase M28 [Siphonobacter sp. BAB-5405]
MIKKFLGLFLVSLTASAQIPQSILTEINTIDSNRIKAHVAYLADDKLLGRKAGAPGYKMAADYIVEQYKKMGLQPAGEKGGYLQEVYLRNSKIKPETASLTLTLPSGEQKSLKWGVDFVFTPHPEKTTVDFNAPLVFVGAGFDTPQINFDDYRNVNVKGKIVVVLRKIPENVPANVKLHLGYPATAQTFAAKHGAIGVLVCNYTNSPILFRSSATNYSLNGINASVSKSGERVSSAAALGGKIQVAGGLSVQALQQLMQAEGIALDALWLKLERGEYVSQPLKSKISGHYESTFTNMLSYNVIGKIEGSDSKLKKEYVIHSAHLDHLGTGKPVNGDSIYNGAHDNASGVACALEMARTYANLKEKPKRSLLFLMVTAEEMGLLGSGYFTAFPTVPKRQIVADINTDMPTLLAPLESVAPLGAEHSSLQKVVEEAAKAVNLQVEPDPDPSEGRFVRSDQYNFVKAGIPALHIKYGYAKANPALNLAEKVKIWRDANYHKVSDNLNDSFVWSAGRKYVQVNFLISYLIAQNPVRPSWNKGDFFEVTQ